MTPGLTCTDCTHPLYPSLAIITSDGYRHRHCPRFCSIGGCDETHRARGWCDLHYRQWRTFGHPMTYKGFELEDVEWIVECGGVGLDEAASRFNLLPGSLAKRLRDLGRHDLSDALLERNPRDWNRSTLGDNLPTTRTPQEMAAKKARRNEVRKAARRESVAA